MAGGITMLLKKLIGAAALAFALSAASAIAQVPDLSKYPDWSGQWRRPPGVGIQFDQSKPLGLRQQAPLTPEYQKIYEAGLADQAAGGQGTDPTYRCIPFGMPRMTSAIFPFEILIMPRTTHILSDYNMPRRIFTDGRDFPAEFESNYDGYSIGQWVDTDGDGKYDELRVETRGMRGPRSFEASGIPLHADNQTVVKERMYLDKTDRNVFYDELTVIDNALTRPWVVTKKYVRQPDPVWYEQNCSEDNHQVLLGKENYFLGGDGLLMPTKKNQPPPDLRYFNQTQR
jgi:hypothetical protein